MTSSQQWVAINIKLLQRMYGEIWYASDLRWILILKYKMPPCFSSKSSALFIRIPIHNLSIRDGFAFYLNKGLMRIDGKPCDHLFDDDSYNDLRHKKYSKLSYHLNDFRPVPNVRGGDTLIDVCRSIFYFLGDERGIGNF